jgi:hypothetical protein
LSGSGATPLARRRCAQRGVVDFPQGDVMMPRTILRCVLLLASLLAAGCSTTAPDVVVSLHHPANPAAAEAPLPADSTTLALPTPGAR